MPRPKYKQLYLDAQERITSLERQLEAAAHTDNIRFGIIHRLLRHLDSVPGIIKPFTKIDYEEVDSDRLRHKNAAESNKS